MGRRVYGVNEIRCDFWGVVFVYGETTPPAFRVFLCVFLEKIVGFGGRLMLVFHVGAPFVGSRFGIHIALVALGKA